MFRMSWPYIAAFLDGEGFISTGSFDTQHGNVNPGRLVIGFAQKEPKVLIEIQNFLTSQEIPFKLYKFKSGSSLSKGSIMHTLRGFSKDGNFKFLNNVLPYLVVKKTLAEDAFRLMKIYHGLSTKTHRSETKEKMRISRKAFLVSQKLAAKGPEVIRFSNTSI